MMVLFLYVQLISQSRVKRGMDARFRWSVYGAWNLDWMVVKL